MCRFLHITRSSVYYRKKSKEPETEIENAVINEFNKNWRVYGTRKLKRALKRRTKPILLSRRKIGNIMKKYGLISKYTIARSKRRKNRVNEEKLPNILNREFNDRIPMEVVVSDLTYIKVAGKWHYICLLIDLSAREIIGFAAGRSKEAKLVRTAFYRVNGDLRNINVFHTDRGSEYKNEIVDNIITAFGMNRSLSAKGAPIDNAVAESMYNTLKIEMVFDESFENLDKLELRLFEYVNWYNNNRLHGSLGYYSPVEYKTLLLKT